MSDLQSDNFLRPRNGPLAAARLNNTVTRITVIVITALTLMYILMPVYWMLKSSFQSANDIRAMPPQWLPKELSLQAYRDLGELIPIGRYIYNSIFVSLVAAVLSTAIGSSAAYVLSRFKFPGMSIILVMILMTQIIPPITRAFPIYFTIQSANLLNTYLGLIVAYVGFSLPFSVLLLRGYFQNNCPPDLEEAAMVDGCSHFGAFLRVILPVSMPGLAAVTIFTFLNAWNDFLWASLLLNQGAMKTIQVGIGDFAGEGGGVQYINIFMAACVVATIPALIMFLFVQRWLVSGLTSGSVK
ncbi:carbohydrate ABC transporter permease [Litoreibacter albidus]|uniref:sn-glycerol-3-phosphate transport system permease protein UgpE n=1 Tax=Litoreibacter albidus TaxID=670155 RepID=A0A1H3CRI2_9RHOB|nr:carbohydrate ABC transporter permease [Litoreibacter albidus]SDX56029.1 carbohydrate ABC transporter membrane protein 2, CUT1 family [Litoreibacter albidus]